MIEQLRLRPYALPLKSDWRAATATLSLRRGLLIGVEGGGEIGWGDCAPLPSSGAEGHERAFAQLRAAAHDLRHASFEAARARLNDIESPEARWALDTALFDQSMRRRGLALRRALSRQPLDLLPVNAALGPLDASCADRAELAVAQGFVFAKIKVGLAPVAKEAARLAEVSARVGGRLRLRLDANRAWSEPDAIRFLDAVADLPIDGVEEPLAEPSVERLRWLQKRTPFALAIDESLFELGPERVFDLRAARRLVLKPARIGGFGASLRLAERAAAAGMEVVITSVVESAIGVAAAAQLAAALGAGIAHGLATGPWLAEDVAPPLVLSEGFLRLPECPGLGVAPFGHFAQG
jgi:o-succinylbenzoate synthase